MARSRRRSQPRAASLGVKLGSRLGRAGWFIGQVAVADRLRPLDPGCLFDDLFSREARHWFVKTTRAVPFTASSLLAACLINVFDVRIRRS
jgi:hypothetical protein